jgi:hypothetical protein
MKLPYFKAWDVTPIVVHITDGFTEGGVPNEVSTYTGTCNLSEKSKTVRQPDGTIIQLNATLTICGDIAPSVPVLTGIADIAGRSWNVATSARPRNPDGTINHTELGLQ